MYWENGKAARKWVIDYPPAAQNLLTCNAKVIDHFSQKRWANATIFNPPFLLSSPIKPTINSPIFLTDNQNINQMEKLPLFLILFSLAISMAMADSNEVDEWFGNLQHAKERTTRLHFYFHDTTSGKNPSARRVAQAPSTNKSPTFFGLINMMDDPLTEGPEATSKLVGRGQGLYASSGLDELSLLMAWNVIFESGDYNGSSLTILGRNPTTHPLREMSIVGGTGVFRMARGVVTLKTYFFNSSAGVAVVQVDVVAIHY